MVTKLPTKNTGRYGQRRPSNNNKAIELGMRIFNPRYPLSFPLKVAKFQICPLIFHAFMKITLQLVNLIGNNAAGEGELC